MNNIYVISSTDFIIINKNISDILIKHSLDKSSIIRYDLFSTPIDRAINDLDTYSMFSNNKVVVCENATSILGERKKSSLSQDEESLIKYINNPNEENVLILVTDKITEDKDIVKLLRDKATFMNTNISTTDLIKDNLEGYKMDLLAINSLIEYALNDNDRVLNELEKLKLYKEDAKVITRNDVEEVCFKTFNDQLYNLSNAIIDRNIPKALDWYHKFCDNGFAIQEIIGSIADYILKIYQVKVLANMKLSDQEIAKAFEMKKVAQASVLRNKSYQYSGEELLKLIISLADLDLNIKKGILEEKNALDLFIISLKEDLC